MGSILSTLCGKVCAKVMRACGCGGVYEPFDEESGKTTLVDYVPSKIVTKLDKFAGGVGGAGGCGPGDLPPTRMGAFLSVWFYSLLVALIAFSAQKLFSDKTVLVPGDNININLDLICAAGLGSLTETQTTGEIVMLIK
jgi:hypothetical protein